MTCFTGERRHKDVDSVYDLPCKRTERRCVRVPEHCWGVDVGDSLCLSNREIKEDSYRLLLLRICTFSDQDPSKD